MTSPDTSDGSRQGPDRHLLRADRLAKVGLLASGFAHEMNNLAYGVLLSLDALARSQEAEDERAVLERRFRQAQDLANRIAHIAQDLVEFASARYKRLAQVEVNGVLENVLRLAEPTLRSRVTVLRQYGAIPDAIADETWLGQVALNLILNASQAFDTDLASRNSIWIRTWSQSDEVCFEVRDNGRGVPAEIRDRIFMPFFTTRAAEEGSGLGLAVCISIIDWFGGSLDLVETAEGQGSHFVVRLKAAPPLPLCR